MEKNEASKAIEHANKMVEVVDAYPDQKKDEANNYILVLNHIIEILIQFKMYKETTPYLDKLDNLLISTIHTERMLFLRTHKLRIEVAIKQGEFESGIDSAIKVIENLKIDEDRIQDELLHNMYFLLSHLYFGLKDYKKALMWINQILNSKRKSREDVKSIAAIFFLIIHLEIGNIDLLEYHVKSTYRTLFKKNRLFELENILIEFIENILKSKTDKQLSNQYIILENNLRTVLNDKEKLLEYNALDYFDFYAWSKSKINNISYSKSLS